MAKAYLPSRSDAEILRLVVEDWRSRRVNPADRARQDLDDLQGPEVYIAVTPAGGIPAFEDVGTGTWETGADIALGCEGKPGSAECDIYQLAEDGNPPCIVQVGLTKTVYNLGAEIGPGERVKVIRDKFGSWFVDSSSGGSSGGGGGGKGDGQCYQASFQSTDVLLATCNGQYVTLTYDKASGRWEASQPLTYYTATHYGTGTDYTDTFSGYPVFWFEGGTTHLSMDRETSSSGTLPSSYSFFMINPSVGTHHGNQMELLNCGDGCFTGGPLTGHLPACGWGACGAPTFSVCVACSPGVTIPCCPGVTVPYVLYGTLTDIAGMGIADGTTVTFEIAYTDSMTDIGFGLHPGWQTTIHIQQVAPPAAALPVIFQLVCNNFATDGSGWTIRTGTQNFYRGYVVSDCSPFYGSLSVFFDDDDTTSALVTVTATNPDPHAADPCGLGTGGGGGGVGGDCFSTICASTGVSGTLNVTTSGTTGHYTNLPASFTMLCSDGGTEAHVWHSYSPYTIVGGSVAGYIYLQPGPGGAPELFHISFGTPPIANSGYSCYPAGFVFVYDDHAGNAATFTVSG